jgi:3-deoxy-D-manno-octulosonate 8-phosphate phosphatase KdsC-like HAD superfamily phosphatase
MKKHAHFITERSGGDGAVAEVIELLLKKMNKWDTLMKRYLL